MDIKNFVLSYYKNADENFHIQKVEKPLEAKKMHTHDYFQIYYIKRGSLIHYLEGDRSQLVKGDMFIIPPGVAHRIEDDENTVFYSISFTLDSLGSGYSLAADFLKRLSEGEIIRPKISLPDSDTMEIGNLVEEIYREFCEKRIAYGDIIKAYNGAMLTIFARSLFEASDSITPIENDREFMLHCIEYIKNNSAENITLGKIVRLSAMSRSRFCSMFMAYTGCSFNRYLNRCRIEKAARYIRDGYKITAIYGLCGYNDFSTFYRNFKAVMGVSPKEYSLSFPCSVTAKSPHAF